MTVYFSNAKRAKLKILFHIAPIMENITLGNVSFPDEAIRGIKFFSAQVNSFPIHCPKKYENKFTAC